MQGQMGQSHPTFTPPLPHLLQAPRGRLDALARAGHVVERAAKSPKSIGTTVDLWYTPRRGRRFTPSSFNR